MILKPDRLDPHAAVIDMCIPPIWCQTCVFIWNYSFLVIFIKIYGVLGNLLIEIAIKLETNYLTIWLKYVSNTLVSDCSNIMTIPSPK